MSTEIEDSHSHQRDMRDNEPAETDLGQSVKGLVSVARGSSFPGRPALLLQSGQGRSKFCGFL